MIEIKAKMLSYLVEALQEFEAHFNHFVKVIAVYVKYRRTI